MPVAFKKYQRDSTEIKDLGTVKSLAGKQGKVKFLRKNFKDKSKQVALIVERKDGASAVIPCSAQVSQLVREAEITMSQLVGLQVIEFDHRDKVDPKTGKPVRIYLVAAPQGGGIQEFSTDDLEPQEFELSAEFLPEGLITLE